MPKLAGTVENRESILDHHFTGGFVFSFNLPGRVQIGREGEEIRDRISDVYTASEHVAAIIHDCSF